IVVPSTGAGAASAGVVVTVGARRGAAGMVVTIGAWRGAAGMVMIAEIVRCAARPMIMTARAVGVVVVVVRFRSDIRSVPVGRARTVARVVPVAVLTAGGVVVRMGVAVMRMVVAVGGGLGRQREPTGRRVHPGATARRGSRAQHTDREGREPQHDQRAPLVPPSYG
uniref:hypothetical protein n=1 Tax=Rhabdothermincola sp. TaxID=2820405 RepID=UPI002FE28C90